MVEDLYIKHQYSQLVWRNDAIENALWWELLLPFSAVKNLYLAKEFALGIAAALEELVWDRITEVLPSLQNIFVEELEPDWRLFQKHIGQFITARQLSSHPVAINHWDRGVERWNGEWGSHNSNRAIRGVKRGVRSNDK